TQNWRHLIMPTQQAGFPHWEVQFDANGGLAVPDTSPDEMAGLADIFVFSHGWNNDATAARSLYERFFTEMRSVCDSNGIAVATIGTVGILWPSMRWADESPPVRAGGAASTTGGPPAVTDRKLVEDLAQVFTSATQRAALTKLADLLDAKPADVASLNEFQAQMKQLVSADTDAAAPEDNGEANGLFGQNAHTVFQRFAAIAPQRHAGGAADIGDVFGSLWNGAKEALRATTYWEMKKRAGIVGSKGLGPWINRVQVKNPSLKVHLIGHSFGARLVSNSLTALSSNAPFSVESVFLLQGAFSHFAFAGKLPFDSSRSGALVGMNRRVDGPLCVTHSLKDTAVGTAYPLASITSHDDASAVSDALYRWGAMGHDGAQDSGATEAVLGPVGTKYSFGIGAFINLDANSIITQGGPPSGAHSDIVHPEIAWAVLAAARLTRS
ncbi:MAG: serine-threonine protein kinase, partial [Gemmatimonadaceae bacterium]